MSLRPALACLLLAFALPAIAQDAPAPAETPVAPAPAGPVVEEVRETYNGAGQLVRRLTLVGGQLVAEISHSYDAAGHLVEIRRTTAGGHTTVETQVWGADGTLSSRSTATDDGPPTTETYTWSGGRLASSTRVEGERTEVTTWTYDVAGNSTLVETKTVDGALVARTIADRAPAPEKPVPIGLSLSAGVDTDSDVQTTSITGGFALSRKPSVDQYDTDPLEVSAYATYTRGVSKGVRTNDDLSAGFGLDYNRFVKNTTAFLFVVVARNPVANLDLDLEAAPFGLKYEIVPKGGVFWTDISFAPLWNYRSILVAAGETCDDVTVDVDTHCTSSDLRGSLRYRLGVEKGGFTLKDTVEYLPSLTPDGDFAGALVDESILRNTAALSVKLTDRLSLSETLVFTRDLRLQEQVDCTASPDSLMCDGLSLQSTSALSLDLSF